MSDRPSVCPYLEISVTTKPIGFYFSGNLLTGPVVVLGNFLGGGTPKLPKKKNLQIWYRRVDSLLPHKASLPEARGETASNI